MAVGPCPDRRDKRARLAFAACGRGSLFALTLGCAALVASATAQALDPDSDLAKQLQAERRQRMELVVARSSQQIESKDVEGTQLASAFRARGVARRSLQQHAEALEDLTRAVELDPFNPQSYEERGRTYLKLRDFTAASADLEMALGLDSKRWSAQRDRGRLAAYQGDFYQAWAQFQRAWRLADDEASVYNAVWLDIAKRRVGEDGTRVLDDLLEQLQPDQWPAPVYRMLRGTLSPDEAVAAATSMDPRKTLLQKCEAYFYAGQLYLMRGETDQAKAAFQASVATGATEYLEYDWAMRELELLGQQSP
jgi:lipoprotein NlpI